LAWDLLKAFVHDWDLTDPNLINEAELTIRFRNGSLIRLAGTNTEAETLKIKGGQYAMVVVDEAQMFPGYLRKLLQESLDVAVRNVQGTIMVLGTPPPSIIGPFVELLNNPSWKSFHGTARENPFFAAQAGCTFEEAKAAFMAENGFDEKHPTVLREYEGELVTDTNALAVKIPDYALYEELPADSTNCVLGLDLGWSDATSISPGFWPATGVVYLGDEDIATHQEGHELAIKLRNLDELYNPEMTAVDTAGNRLSFETLQADLYRQGVYMPMEPRKTIPIKAQIGIVNAALAQGKLKVKRSSRFYQDAQLVVWKDGVVGSDLAGLHSDAIASATYMYQCALPRLPEVIPDIPKTKEQKEKAEAKARQEANRARQERAAKKYRQGPKDEDEPWGETDPEDEWLFE
jgi:hypothetical protein